MKNKIIFLLCLLCLMLPVHASQQVIFTGTVPNDHTGDSPYVQWTKGNANFTDLYSTVAFLTSASNYFGNVVVLANAKSTNGYSVVFTNQLPTIAAGSGYTVSTNVTGSNVIYTLSITMGGAGTVVSAGLTLPTVLFNSPITGSPITTSGTFAPTLANQTANTSLRGPVTGAPGPPTFRADVAADIPNLPGSIITSGTVADAYLSPNIPLINGNNSFTGTETFGQNVTLNGSGNSAPSQTVSANNLVTFVLADARYDAINAASSLFTKSNVWAVPGTNAFNGVVLATNIGNQITGTLTGNGAAITALNGSSVASGTVADARLSANIPLLNSPNTFSGFITNATNFTGNGTDNELPFQTRVSSASIATAGSVSNDITANTIPGYQKMNTNNPNFFGTLSGTNTGAHSLGWTNGALTTDGAVTAASFSGSGASLTALNGSQVTSGTVPVTQLGSASSSGLMLYDLGGSGVWSNAPSGGTTPAFGPQFTVGSSQTNLISGLNTTNQNAYGFFTMTNASTGSNAFYNNGNFTVSNTNSAAQFSGGGAALTSLTETNLAPNQVTLTLGGTGSTNLVVPLVNGAVYYCSLTAAAYVDYSGSPNGQHLRLIVQENSTGTWPVDFNTAHLVAAHNSPYYIAMGYTNASTGIQIIDLQAVGSSTLVQIGQTMR